MTHARADQRLRGAAALVWLAALLGPAPGLCQEAGFRLRLGSGEKELARYREAGANVAVVSGIVRGGFTQLATYRRILPQVLPEGHPLAGAIESERRELREKLKRAAELGLAVCLVTDEVQMPTAVLEAVEGSITVAGDPRQADLSREEFWRLHREKYREVLSEFPQVAYVMVRTGENYSHLLNGYSGLLIARRNSGQAPGETYIRNMQRLMEETRRVVVDEFGRTLIWRTWDLGNHGFHASPEVYDRILAGVGNRKGMILSIKFTQTDFWRYNDFNPNIGRGGVEQIVEFQCAREYEGKGAFPDYVGEEHAEAMRHARRAGARGVWLWHFEGGWGGPRLASDRWVRLNIFATSRLAQDPGLSPAALAEEWAGREFGRRAARRMAEMLMLSDDCVLAFNYIAPYARKHRGWLPSRNLLRDDIIGGEKGLGGAGILRLLYEGSKDSLDEVYAEKRRAVVLASRMLALAEAARAAIIAERGERVYLEVRNSLLYVEALARVISHYVQGMFRYYSWKETKAEGARAAALKELLRWRSEWNRYQREIGKLEGIASLYRSQTSQEPGSTSGAMADTCESAIADLEKSAR